MMHKDAEEMEILCKSAVRNGGLRQMFTDQEMLHRMALVSRASSVCIREGLPYNNQMIKR